MHHEESQSLSAVARNSHHVEDGRPSKRNVESFCNQYLDNPVLNSLDGKMDHIASIDLDPVRSCCCCSRDRPASDLDTRNKELSAAHGIALLLRLTVLAIIMLSVRLEALVNLLKHRYTNCVFNVQLDQIYGNRILALWKV